MKMIDNWAEHWWRLASMRLAALAGFVAAYFVAQPQQLQAIIETIPEELRPFAAPLIGMTVTAVAGATRLVQFKSKPGEAE